VELEGISRGDRFPHYKCNIPEELKTEERWVTCDEYKVPLVAIPTGACFAASSTDPDTWRDYATALRTWEENEHIAGVGRVIGEDEDYVGVDLDDCIDPATGEVLPWAERILERLGTYCEISPSLTGVKAWVKAPELARSYKKPGIEIYCGRRYFTSTGLTLGEPVPIRDAGAELAAIIGEEFPAVGGRLSTTYDGPKNVIDLEALLERAGLTVFGEVHQERSAEITFLVCCPWVLEHTDADDSGTRTGRYENGALFFRCEHSHCAHRNWRDFRHFLESLIHLGRPPRGGARGRLR